MTEIWFLEDIDRLIKSRKRVVILDPSGSCEFLLRVLAVNKYEVLKTDKSLKEKWEMVKEELFLRYSAETKLKNKNVIFYVTRKQEDLSFLFDYCFTHGSLDLTNPAEWLKQKLFASTNLQIQHDSNKLLLFAKLGVGKDINWWKKIVSEIEKPLKMEDELLPFLKNPKQYLNALDEDISQYTNRMLFSLIGKPFIAKPPKTLANEVVNLIFEKLLNNDIEDNLLKIYYKWRDSNEYSESLQTYISHYKIDPSVNIWGVHPDHCFTEIDKLILIRLCENMRDASYIKDKLVKLKVRANSIRNKGLIPEWLKDVILLLESDDLNLQKCNSFQKITNYYTDYFYKIDRAIRKLYSEFLHEENIIRPLQELYESLNSSLLKHWFEHLHGYKTNQQGFLIDLLKSASPGIAVIVGDGIRYEIAEFVASELDKKFSVDRNIIFADLPSETEHNMSALYAGNNSIIKLLKDRESTLSGSVNKPISFLNLEQLYYGAKEDYLVLTYKDIDSTGETLQHGAIKLFDEFERVLIEKISLLLNVGYQEVHLITDHGFVLTGLMDEADKITPKITGKKEVHERFIRTVQKQTDPDLICLEKKYEEYNFVCFAKNHRPFKSRGVYGYSHGGFTPQEIITPHFVFRKKTEESLSFGVIIENKKELSEVTGDLFEIKVTSLSDKTDLFISERKIQILLFANNNNISVSNVVQLETNVKQTFNFSFGKHEVVRAILIDAETREQLDEALIKKSDIRDLGGLL